MTLENRYQASLIKKLTEMGCFVLKNDADYLPGVPDLTVFYKDRWACLEVKKSKSASARPNQSYYVELLDSMSYAAFIYPENEDEILDELQHALGIGRRARVSFRE